MNVFAALTDDLKCFSSSNLWVASISVFFFLSDSVVNSQLLSYLRLSLCDARGGGHLHTYALRCHPSDQQS